MPKNLGNNHNIYIITIISHCVKVESVSLLQLGQSVLSLLSQVEHHNDHSAESTGPHQRQT